MFRYYVIAIISGSAIISLLNEIFVSPTYSVELFGATLLTLGCVLSAVGVDALIAIGSRYLIPQRYYDPLKPRFACARFEKKLYIKLGIRKWKDKIPETGGLLVGFQKSTALDLHDNAYVYKFMQETCYAEVMHIWSAVLCFVLILICPAPFRVTVAMPVVLVNFVLQILPVMVQRFVRPQLTRVYLSNKKRAERQM